MNEKYVIQPGDNLSAIASNAGITVEELLRLNPNIQDPNNISVGDEIVVQQPQEEQQFSTGEFTTRSDRRNARGRQRPTTRNARSEYVNQNRGEGSQASNLSDNISDSLRNTFTPTGYIKALQEYGNFISGNTSDITEEDFTDRQLELLREVVRRKQEQGSNEIIQEDYTDVAGGTDIVTGNVGPEDTEYSERDAIALSYILGGANIDEEGNVSDNYDFNWTPEGALQLARKNLNEGNYMKAGMNTLESIANPIANITRRITANPQEGATLGMGNVGQTNEITDDVTGEEFTQPQRKVNINLNEERASGGFINNQTNDMTNAQRRRLEKELGLGGFIKNNLSEIGTVAGAGAGALLGNPVMGAKLGGMAGGMGQQALQDDPQQPTRRRRPVQYAASTSGQMAYGGKMKKQYRNGGQSQPIGQDAQEFVGPKHENGGIGVNRNTEVEGGETMDNVDGGDYVFSDRLTVPESVRGNNPPMTFAEYHKMLVEENAPTSEIDELAQIQEEVSGRDKGGQPDDNPIRTSNRTKPTEQSRTPTQRRRPTQRKMAYGGKKELANGGDIDPVRQIGLVPDTINNPNLEDNIVSNTPTEINYDVDLPSTGETSSNFRFDGEQATSMARQGLPYLPAAMNLTRGLTQSSDVPNVPVTTPQGRAEDTIRNMETDVNVNPQLASVDRSIRNLTSDPNASMNQKLAAASRGAQQRAQIQNQAEMQENQLQNQQSSQLASAQQNRDQMNAQMQTQADQMQRQQQMQSDEARQQLIQQGLQQAATTFQQQQRYGDMLENDSMRFRAMIEGMPEGSARTQILQRLMEQYPERREQLQRLMPNN